MLFFNCLQSHKYDYTFTRLLKQWIISKKVLGAEAGACAAQAKRMGIEGKVFVQFVVEKDGSLTDVKVVKGIGAGRGGRKSGQRC